MFYEVFNHHPFSNEMAHQINQDEQGNFIYSFSKLNYYYIQNVSIILSGQ
jgi:hypothetical protein